MFPIEPPVLGAFVVAAVAIIVSPGPDTIIILRHALTGGRESGWPRSQACSWGWWRIRR